MFLLLSIFLLTGGLDDHIPIFWKGDGYILGLLPDKSILQRNIKGNWITESTHPILASDFFSGKNELQFESVTIKNLKAIDYKTTRFIPLTIGKKRVLGSIDLVIMSYNVNNFIIDKKSSRGYKYKELDPYRSNWHHKDIYQKKVDSLIEVILKGNLPDIIALQELGNSETFFDDIYLVNNLKELGYYYFSIDKQDRNVDVTTGFISKYPMRILPSLKLKEDPTFNYQEKNGLRNISKIELNFLNKVLTIYNNHWPSQGSGRIGKRRSVIRKKVREVLMKDLSNDNILLIGDFNQENLYFNNFFNLWHTLDRLDRWEYIYRNKKETLSYLFFKGKDFFYLPNSFEVIRSFPLVIGENIFEWQILKKKKIRDFYEHLGMGYSDHLPLIATFTLFEDKTKEDLMRLSPLEKCSSFYNFEKELGRCIHLEGKFKLMDKKYIMVNDEKIQLKIATKDLRKLKKNSIVNSIKGVYSYDKGSPLLIVTPDGIK